MKRILLLFCLFLLGICVGPINSYATLVTDITGLINDNEMAGMKVHVESKDTAVDGTYNWTDYTTGGSGVQSTGFSLTMQAGDTAFYDWVLTTDSSIDKITISGIQANIIFDVIDTAPLTDGSGYGTWQTSDPENGWIKHSIDNPSSAGTTDYNGTVYDADKNFMFKWSFTDPIYTSGTAVTGLGDAFGSFELDFIGSGSSTSFDATKNFDNLRLWLDTDKATPVPAPSAGVLLGFGLLFLSYLQRSRK